MPSESDFLQWLYAQQRSSSVVRTAAGDDLAVLNWAGSRDLMLVGIDQVLDGVHFDSQVHSPRDIGRKAMNRNISDCAAMACLPVAAVASVALSRGSSLEFAKELYLGMKDAADAYDCAIVGGDTSAWDGKLALTVAIIGKSDGIDPVTRSGAKAGDGIFVTGPLGGSIRGRHLNFIPRVKLAREIAATGKITAMIDISDGLSRDLRQICNASVVSALVEAARIPIHEDATGLEAALHDGEDHELLFTAGDDFHHSGCMRIGSILPSGEGAPPVQIEKDGQRDALPERGWIARW
ncbi:MAG: thiamine-monophosphate kinase [Anaerolineae bacterium]|nr:thiamine-monophosphate kinase [Phycisphaerae bacterium]